ncbi:hypothetical protein Z043_121020 [Scleropages formosus]|uniref:Uncharacterized protein n=1 Tax=Scleropages formosus TaxID=113540 RepID=A0A0P7TJ88_SCLFO|nr:hypothetical protein Z043_121020 [Scleropages formosus]
MDPCLPFTVSAAVLHICLLCFLRLCLCLSQNFPSLLC